MNSPLVKEQFTEITHADFRIVLSPGSYKTVRYSDVIFRNCFTLAQAKKRLLERWEEARLSPLPFLQRKIRDQHNKVHWITT